MIDTFAKKRFGQNFLSDEFIIESIVSLINPHPNDHLVEIGPGLGAITLPLLPHVAKIDAVELDRDIIPILTKKTTQYQNLNIYQQDALGFELDSLTKKEKSLRIIGNLPYNISTPLLFHLLRQKAYIIDMHFMLQKEVALRLGAKPCTKQFGRLSVMTQYHCEVEVLLDVPPSAFKPSPKVDSMFIRLIPRQPNIVAKDISKLDHIVKTAFGKRRKTLHNALKGLITNEELFQLGIDPNRRAEELSVENFVVISNMLS